MPMTMAQARQRVTEFKFESTLNALTGKDPDGKVAERKFKELIAPIVEDMRINMHGNPQLKEHKDLIEVILSYYTVGVWDGMNIELALSRLTK